jgi:hypothetical protein
MGYIKGLSAPSALEVEAFGRLFDGNLTASEAEAMDVLFPAVRKGQAAARTQGHLLDRTAASVLVVSFYVISQQKVFC